MATDSIHPENESVRKEEVTGLSTSRADFSATLPRRIESVVVALDALELQLDAPGPRDNLLRRIHALSASAKVLGFAAAADVLSRVEQRIRTSQIDTLADDLKLSRKNLTDIPSMVHRGSYSIAPPYVPQVPTTPPTSARERVESPHDVPSAHLTTSFSVNLPRTDHPHGTESVHAPSEPFCVLLFGTNELEQSLRSASSAHSGLELTSTTNPDELPELAAAIGPDILLLDATQGSITLLVEELSQSPETAGIPIVVLNVPSEATSSLVEQGVRTALSSQATDQQILVALQQARKPVEERPHSLPPFGEVSLKDLANRLAQEIHQGLVEAAGVASQTERIPLGDGTQVRAALWSALAQIREHVEEQSDGRIHFDRGPDGSIPLAPGPATTARRSSSSFGAVDLTGRRILVVDDDPAVAWLVSGTLRAAGALVTETHDGQRALELSYRLWPELIVSDILMPGLDGFALCHALKRDVLLRDVPIVLLSWKEDLLFRLRDLGTDADGYLRKEATASTIVQRVQELLRPRHALERRLTQTLTEINKGEARGRLDATTVRLLLEIAVSLEQPVRIALRDATALYDLRIREGSLKAITRTRNDGTVEHGNSVLAALIGVTAGRFSVTLDNEPCEPEFESPLNELLRPVALRARAAQRVLSGLSLGFVEQLVLERDSVAEELNLLPLSLRPVADELLRGVSPRQLLATGAASVHLLESLLSDVARRGAVRSITGTSGEDLLEQEIIALSATPAAIPSKPAPAPTPLFTFQLSPAPPVTIERSAPRALIEQVAPPIPIERSEPTPTVIPKTDVEGTRQPNPETWSRPSGTLSGFGISGQDASVPLAIPVSNPPSSDDVDWAMELNWDTTPLAPEPSAPPSSTPPSKGPASTVGFMRPTLPTLSRQRHNETPDLANAVVKAVSEVTPAPVISDENRAKPEKLSLEPEPVSPVSLEPASVSPVSLEPVSVNPVSLEPVSVNPVSLEPNALVPESDRPNVAQEKSEPAVATVLAGKTVAVATAGSTNATIVATPLASILTGKSATGSQSDTPLLSLATKALSPVAPLAQASSPLVCPPPLAGLSDVTLGITQTPTFGATLSATSEPTSRIATATVPSTVDAPKLEPIRTTVSTPDPGHAEPAATHGTPPLPVVQRPPRPSDHRAPHDREHDSDPVFPLVSTSPHVVEIQPPIEIGDAASHSTANQTDFAPQPDRTAPPTRDTLRSPGDTTPPNVETLKVETAETQPSTADEVFKVATTEGHPSTPKETPIAALTEAEPASVTDPKNVGTQKTASTALAPYSPATSENVSKAAVNSSVPASATASRTVSWIQALGLSLLAGVVTFAMTVPIARWVRDRRNLHDNPPIATAEPLTFVSAAPSVSSPAGSSFAEAAPPSPANAQPSATLESIATPSDVTLAPGQSLIEIVTAAGHAIFVDDSFVGRGPVRVVTVTPGRHVVRTRLNGIERSDTIEIGAGRSMRLSLEQAWK